MTRAPKAQKGRTGANRRTVLLSFTPAEYAAIAYEAKHAQLPVAAYVRAYLTKALAL